MTTKIATLAGVAATIGFVGLSGGAVSAQSGAGCNRACLRGVLDAYLVGVIRHDPSAAPLAANYRGTENAVDVPKGEGMWKTVVGLGEVQRRYLDAVNGTAAYYGLINEADGEGRYSPTVVSVQITVKNRKVTGAEWIYGRKGAPLYSPQGLIWEPPSDDPIPVKARSTRAQLLAAADSYFEGIEKHDSDLVKNIKGCPRIENGTHATGTRPANLPPAPARGGGARAGRAGPVVDAAVGAAGAGTGPAVVNASERRGEPADCGNGMEGTVRVTKEVAGRHYPVLDEVAGMALGTGIFVRVPGTTAQRLLLSEYFTVRDAKIASVHAAMVYLPANAPNLTGWEVKK